MSAVWLQLLGRMLQAGWDLGDACAVIEGWFEQ